MMESNLSCGVSTLLCCFDQHYWVGPALVDAGPKARPVHGAQ